MTVGELVKELQTYDENMLITAEDTRVGMASDITKIEKESVSCDEKFREYHFVKRGPEDSKDFICINDEAKKRKVVEVVVLTVNRRTTDRRAEDR